MKSPRLSIICPTYNQVNYIRQTLDGFVRQHTTFPFEVIVHDDASTDGTAEIIREYAARHPGLFRPVMETKNQCSRGIPFLQQSVFPLVRGEYVAFCEGDDYWTDERKLQLQVDWLDAHPESGLCFHPVIVHYEDGSCPDGTFPPPDWGEGNTCFTFGELLCRNFVQTNSVVYRWRMKEPGNVLPEGIMPEDWYMHLLHAERGEIGFLPEMMSVYRRHSGGIWWGDRDGNDFYIRNGIAHLFFYRAVHERFGHWDAERNLFMMRKTLVAALRTGNQKILMEMAERFPAECVMLGESVANSFARQETTKVWRSRMQRLSARRVRRLKRLMVILSAISAALVILSAMLSLRVL